MSEKSYRRYAQIARLQKNLCALRRIAGWTMEELYCALKTFAVI